MSYPPPSPVIQRGSSSPAGMGKFPARGRHSTYSTPGPWKGPHTGGSHMDTWKPHATLHPDPAWTPSFPEALRPRTPVAGPQPPHHPSKSASQCSPQTRVPGPSSVSTTRVGTTWLRAPTNTQEGSPSRTPSAVGASAEPGDSVSQIARNIPDPKRTRRWDLRPRPE